MPQLLVNQRHLIVRCKDSTYSIEINTAGQKIKSPFLSTGDSISISDHKTSFDYFGIISKTDDRFGHLIHDCLSIKSDMPSFVMKYKAPGFDILQNLMKVFC